MEDKKEAPAADEEKPQVISSSVDLALVFLCRFPPHFAGKGTVSATLKKELGWIPISAGDCLREEKERFGVEWLGNA